MSGLASRAELDKLGHTLELAPRELAFLEDVPAEHLRALRVAIYERLFEEDRELFGRLARVFQRLPVGQSVALAQRAGPLLTARTAAELVSGRALDVVGRLPTGFVADVCVHLDPRRTRDLIRQLPVERIVDVAKELAARGDFLTMSRFVDFLSDEAVRAVLEAVDDEEAVLRVAFYMGSKNRIDHLLHALGPDRLERIVQAVAERPAELLVPFLSIVVHVSYGLKRELGDLAAQQERSVLELAVRAAHERGLWADLLPAVAAMSPSAQGKVVNLPILRDPEVQAGIIVAADRRGLWGVVLPFIAMMDGDTRDAVARIVATRPRETLQNAADVALMGELWETLLDLVARMPAAKQQELGVIVRSFGEVDPELATRIARRALEHGIGEPFAAVLEGAGVGASAPGISERAPRAAG